MKRYPDLLVQDMLHCIEKIERYRFNQSREQLLNNEQCMDAIFRNIEVIGEAANQLPKEIQLLNTQIAWRDIIAMRNQLIHAYSGIDWELVLDVVEDDLPILKQELLVLQSCLPLQ